MLGGTRTWLGGLCIISAALLGCREERPTGTNPGTDALGDTDTPADATAPGAQPDTPSDPDTPQFPDEPMTDLRARLQAPDRLVLTVHPHGITWVDGELTVGPDLIMRLQSARTADPPKTRVAIIIADGNATPIDAWQGFVQMCQQMGYEDDKIDLVFGGAGFEGLRPDGSTTPATPPGGGSGG